MAPFKVQSILNQMRSDDPIEVHTNGLALLKDKSIIPNMPKVKIWAISIDSFTEAWELRPALEDAGDKARLVLALSDHVTMPFQGWIDFCLEVGIPQFTIRKITKPEGMENEWIDENVGSRTDAWLDRAGLLSDEITTAEYGRVNVMYFPDCLERDDSFIYDVDGRVHNTWIANEPAVVDGE